MTADLGSLPFDVERLIETRALDVRYVKALERIASIANGLVGVKIEGSVEKVGAPVVSVETRLNRRMPEPRRASAPPAPALSGVTAPQQRILDALAKLDAFGVAAPQKPTLAAMAGVSSKSSGFANNLGAMRSAGLIDYPAGGCVALTDTGRAIANAPERAPTLQDLHEGWLAMVTRPQAELLRVLISSYPVELPKLALAARAGVSASSSGFANNLGALRSLGAIDYPQAGHVVATALLFPKGLASG